MSDPFHSLDSEQKLDETVEKSHDEPVIIYKHSRICNLSARAHKELEFMLEERPTPIYKVVVQSDRPISDAVESNWGITHESPQVIILKDGEPVFDASHQDINHKSIEHAVNKAE